MKAQFETNIQACKHRELMVITFKKMVSKCTSSQNGEETHLFKVHIRDIYIYIYIYILLEYVSNSYLVLIPFL